MNAAESEPVTAQAARRWYQCSSRTLALLVLIGTMVCLPVAVVAHNSKRRSDRQGMSSIPVWIVSGGVRFMSHARFDDPIPADGFGLDLRFADGTNYAAAATLAGRFLREDKELFAIKTADKPAVPFRADVASKPATAGAKLADAPLMILVNAQTRGAAEVLAGALRAQDRGILIGASTAGGALGWEDFPLADGRVLRVATAKIELPKGGIFPGGVTPDVPVKIDTKAEEELVLRAATNVTLTASLKMEQAHKMMTEADLVKYHRGESLNLPGPDTTATNKTSDANAKDNGKNGKEPAVVRDVVLQRAVDILKGIRVLLSWQ